MELTTSSDVARAQYFSFPSTSFQSILPALAAAAASNGVKPAAVWFTFFLFLSFDCVDRGLGRWLADPLG